MNSHFRYRILFQQRAERIINPVRIVEPGTGMNADGTKVLNSAQIFKHGTKIGIIKKKRVSSAQNNLLHLRTLTDRFHSFFPEWLPSVFFFSSIRLQRTEAVDTVSQAHIACDHQYTVVILVLGNRGNHFGIHLPVFSIFGIFIRAHMASELISGSGSSAPGSRAAQSFRLRGRLQGTLTGKIRKNLPPHRVVLQRIPFFIPLDQGCHIGRDQKTESSFFPGCRKIKPCFGKIRKNLPQPKPVPDSILLLPDPVIPLGFFSGKKAFRPVLVRLKSFHLMHSNEAQTQKSFRLGQRTPKNRQRSPVPIFSVLSSGDLLQFFLQ
ncbi:MAG: hypothetical protein U0519_03325 [Candidatus Gracilibacteria bacterium]